MASFPLKHFLRKSSCGVGFRQEVKSWEFNAVFLNLTGIVVLPGCSWHNGGHPSVVI